MGQMYKASQDGIALVHHVGEKMVRVVPDFQKYVLGSTLILDDSKGFGDQMPDSKQAHDCLKVFMEVHCRFKGRKFTANGKQKRLPHGPDYRWTEDEIGKVNWFANWLIMLDAHRNTVQTGVPTPVKHVPLVMEHMIVRERLVG